MFTRLAPEPRRQGDAGVEGRARLDGHSARARRNEFQTPELAQVGSDKGFGGDSIVAQKWWRGCVSRARKDQLNFEARLHLGYELHVLELRKRRKGLFIGFLQHMAYMALLITVFFLQHGNTVNNRYVLVETLKNYVGGLKTPSGVKFDSIGSVADVWDWAENAFFEEFAGTSGRVYVRTYNQVIGSVGLTTTRVSDDSCTYRRALADLPSLARP